MPANRAVTGQFVSGVSGNPSGRPKSDPKVKEILTAHSEEAALKLVELMRCKQNNIALMAAQEILNRTQGKPEMMSKIQLSTAQDTRILFQWINDNANNNDTVSAESNAEGNTRAD